MEFIKKWALMFLFITGAFITLEVAIKNVEEERINLINELENLKIALEKVKKDQIDLARQVNSQNDPAWIEIVLKKELGLVPEGQKKIYFLKH